MDGGPQGKYDQIPSRIEGKRGLQELVQEFEDSGGSQGFSRTKWPTSENEWLQEQKRDPEWGPKITIWEQELAEKLRTATTADADLSSVNPNNPNNPGALIIESSNNNPKMVFNGLLSVVSVLNEDTNFQLVVPEQLKRNVLELYHDSKGHPGITRTRDTILLKYWWRNINRWASVVFLQVLHISSYGFSARLSS
jgi:hypothetical protein